MQLRSFSRPLQAVALSPEYKHDRSYLSGGQAGLLVLTTGGQVGKTTHANLGGAAATGQGWLGAVGLASTTGSDRVLHSGEGAVSAIKWSMSGKFVLWTNEQGIKIMRSNLRLENGNSSVEWKRISHIDRPNRPGRESMAEVWKPRAEWIDRNALEVEEDSELVVPKANGESYRKPSERCEEVVVGWGDTVWLIRVYDSPGTNTANGNESKGPRSEIMNMSV